MMRIYIVALFYLLHVTSGQDVSGGTERCHSEIWQKPLMNFSNIDIIRCVPTVIEKDRGDIVDKDPKDPILGSLYMELAKESMEKYLNDSYVTVPHKVVSIDHVSEQSDYGLIIRIDFTIGPDVFGSSFGPEQCHSEIWQKPFMNFTNIDTIRCVPTVIEKERGDIVDKDPKDPILGSLYTELAKESMEKYLNVSHVKAPHKVVSIDHVSEQADYGLVIRIDFTIGPDVPDDSEQ